METSKHPSLERATNLVPLRSRTSDAWVDHALTHIDRLLDDHCQCELKAASNALALVGRNPEKDSLVAAMSALAREEMQHYRQVRRTLLSRGGSLTRPIPSPYLKGVNAERLGGSAALLDDLMVAALVEARSCERFVRLAEGLRDARVPVEDADSLAELYETLARSESGHATLFVDLAREFYSREEVARELERRATLEAEVLAGIEVTPRMHGGNGE